MKIGISWAPVRAKNKTFFQLLIVTGGIDRNKFGFLDSTEIFRDNVWRTIAGKLPVKLARMSAVTFNKRVLLFGKYIN